MIAPAPRRRFDAVLCDVDGVLRHWPADEMPSIDAAHGMPAGTLAAAAFAPERLVPAITGKVTDAEWRACIAADLAPICGSAERAASMVAAWSALTGRLDTVVFDLLMDVRRELPVALVSNATTRLEADLARLGVAEAFDAIVNTSRVGVTKPDPRIYEHAAQIVGVDVRRCLFVDDTPANVEGAREVGMTGVLFTGPAALRAVLSPDPS